MSIWLQLRRCARTSGWVSLLLVPTISGAQSQVPPPGAGPSPASTLSVVLSHATQPYLEATRGLSEVLLRAGIELRQVMLDSDGRLPEGGAGSLGTRPPVIALGQRAQSSLPFNLLKSSVYCMGLEVSSAGGLSLVHGAESRLDRVRKLMPGARTLGILAADDRQASEIADFRQATRQSGMNLRVHRVNPDLPIAGQLVELENRIDVLMGTYDLRLYSADNAQALMVFSYKHRIPLIGISDAWSRAGAPLAFDWDFLDLGRQCGSLVARHLGTQGTVRLPVEQPRRMTHSVNLSAIRYFRIEPPTELIRDASRRFN